MFWLMSINLFVCVTVSYCSNSKAIEYFLWFFRVYLLVLDLGVINSGGTSDEILQAEVIYNVAIFF